jgi:hypothetical protein
MVAISNRQAVRVGLQCLMPALLLLAGCQVERNPLDTYTVSGQNLGPIAFKEIPAVDSKVSFVGDDPTKRREAQSLSDRYSERITFKNNAMLRYDKLAKAGFSDAWTDTDIIQSDVQNHTFYQDLAIVFDKAKIKSGGYYTYLLQSSPTHNCFVFHGSFGDTQKGRVGNPGDQSIGGSLCYPANAKSLDALEREMTGLLARARYDDGAGNRAQPPVQAATAAPVQAAAAAAPPDIGVFASCYSQRLDVLYRARACSPSDKTIDEGERAQISGRLARGRGTNAPAGGVPFAPAPAGTMIYTTDSGYFDVVATDDMMVTTINKAGAIAHRFGLFAPYWIESEVDARAVERIWPLGVGKETHYILTHNDSSWQETTQVVRTERVTVAAGTFDTYVVERHSLGTGSNYFDGTRTFWYAPSVGFIVKFDIKVKAGNANGEKAWEAMKIVRPDAT